MALIERIDDESIEFMECYCNPLCLAETTFSTLDNLVAFDENLAEIRLGQLPMLSYEYMIEENYPGLTQKQNFKHKENSGNVFAFGGRKFGKTLIVEQVDIMLSMLWLDGEHVGFSSLDALHIRGILEKIIQVLRTHEFYKLLEPQINRSPNYRISLKSGYLLESINMNVAGATPGVAFYQKHIHRLYIEEACVEGHTRIRYYDKEGNLSTNSISHLVNSGEYRNIELLTYNHKTNLVERKRPIKAFKKQVKNSKVYTITTDYMISSKPTRLTVSENHRLFVDGSYKTAKETSVGSKMYLLEQCELSELQKQILVGCLLGDSHLNKRTTCSLSFTNSIKTLDYLTYKKDCFGSLFDTYRKTKNSRHTLKRVKSIGEIGRFSSKEVISLNEFRDFKYCKINTSYTKVNEELLNKYLTPISLAFFIMDDGSISTYECKKSDKINDYIYLHTEAFDLETNNLIIAAIKNKFDIQGKVCRNKQYYYISFDSLNTSKLINLVKDYIHPTMLYKLGLNKCNNFIDLRTNEYLMQSVVITDIKEEILPTWTMYCFEVEDNNNFYANGILTGNSLEPEEVYNKRQDSISEDGCVYRVAGMTDFTKYSPAGRTFYDLTKKSQVSNCPQYISPKWGVAEKIKAIQDYGGEQSGAYRVFVKGEVVDEGIAVFDMERVRKQYQYDKQVKTFEINKDNFNQYKDILIIERPKNAKVVYLCGDIGETAPTDIVIIIQVNDKYYYTYEIVAYRLDDKQQSILFEYLANLLQAEVISIDCTEGTGRAIFRNMSEKFGAEKMCFVGFNEKIGVDYERDEKNRVVFEFGKPKLKEEYVSEWSIKRLKHLFYNGMLFVPSDHKLDKQLNSVISKTSGQRVAYTVVCEEDHLLSAMRCFSIAEYKKTGSIFSPINTKKHSKCGV